MTKKKMAGRFNPQRLQALRRRRGLSLRGFGAKVGRSGASIKQIEDGHAHPSMQTVEKIAEVFGVDIREFFV